MSLYLGLASALGGFATADAERIGVGWFIGGCYDAFCCVLLDL
jgi:hypothetical protein